MDLVPPELRRRVQLGEDGLDRLGLLAGRSQHVHHDRLGCLGEDRPGHMAGLQLLHQQARLLDEQRALGGPDNQLH